MSANEWTIGEAEALNWGADWIVRATKQGVDTLDFQALAVSFPADGMSPQEARERAVPLLQEKIALKP